ncbi:Maf1-domain-containing protein [Marasmius fiardii PR-910]|nr:Maf1-domain-containing protein [Marasmius fiardii PR-910]
MKYIENPALSRLAQSLSHEGPECSVNVRMEAYSCKNIKRDKKLFKALEEAYSNDHHTASDSPPFAATLLEPEMTPFGPFDNHSSRKTLYLLISTLNIAFPDHEFSDVRPAHFNREESGASVLNSLSTTLVVPHRAGINAPRTYSSYPSNSPDLFPSSSSGGMTSMSPLTLNGMATMPRSPFSPPPIVTGTHPNVYRLVDDVIGLEECEVYSYTPEIESDPHAVGDFDSDDEEELRDDDDENEYEGVRISSNRNGRWDEDATFEFDDYDIDESPRSSSLNSLYSSRRRSPRARVHIHPGNSASSSVTNSPDTPNNPTIPPRMRPLRTVSLPQGGSKANRLPHRDNSMTNALATPSSIKYQPRRRSSRGALLWSSHWFFLNRKQKRILFVSVWARSRGVGRTSLDEGEEYMEEGYSFYGPTADSDFADFDEDYSVLVVDEHTVKMEEVEGTVGSSNLGNSGRDRFVGWEGGAGAGARAIGLVQG